MYLNIILPQELFLVFYCL